MSVSSPPSRGSAPPRPSSRSAPAPPKRALGAASPVSESAPAPPVRCSTPLARLSPGPSPAPPLPPERPDRRRDGLGGGAVPVAHGVGPAPAPVAHPDRARRSTCRRRRCRSGRRLAVADQQVGARTALDLLDVGGSRRPRSCPRPGSPRRPGRSRRCRRRSRWRAPGRRPCRSPGRRRRGRSRSPRSLVDDVVAAVAAQPVVARAAADRVPPPRPTMTSANGVPVRVSPAGVPTIFAGAPKQRCARRRPSRRRSG